MRYVNDGLAIAGVLSLSGGVWLWVGLGPALVTLGALLLAGGIMGARRAA